MIGTDIKNDSSLPLPERTDSRISNVFGTEVLWGHHSPEDPTSALPTVTARLCLLVRSKNASVRALVAARRSRSKEGTQQQDVVR